MEKYILFERGILVLIENKLGLFKYEGKPVKQCFTKEELEKMPKKEKYDIYKLELVSKGKL